MEDQLYMDRKQMKMLVLALGSRKANLKEIKVVLSLVRAIKPCSTREQLLIVKWKLVHLCWRRRETFTKAQTSSSRAASSTACPLEAWVVHQAAFSITARLGHLLEAEASETIVCSSKLKTVRSWRQWSTVTPRSEQSPCMSSTWYPASTSSARPCRRCTASHRLQSHRICLHLVQHLVNMEVFRPTWTTTSQSLAASTNLVNSLRIFQETTHINSNWLPKACMRSIWSSKNSKNIQLTTYHLSLGTSLTPTRSPNRGNCWKASPIINNWINHKSILAGRTKAFSSRTSTAKDRLPSRRLSMTSPPKAKERHLPTNQGDFRVLATWTSLTTKSSNRCYNRSSKHLKKSKWMKMK